MTLHKEYVETEQHGTVKLSVSFNRSTTNWATSQPKKIGYYLTVLPVKITKHDGYEMEESGCFTGYNICVLEANRQSSKRLQQAIKEVQDNRDKYVSLLNR